MIYTLIQYLQRALNITYHEDRRSTSLSVFRLILLAVMGLSLVGCNKGQKHLETASALKQEGKIDAAIVELEAVERDAPGTKEVGRAKDLALLWLVGAADAPNAAVNDRQRHLEQALKWDPKSGAVQVRICALFVDQGLLPQAKKCMVEDLKDKSGVTPELLSKLSKSFEERIQQATPPGMVRVAAGSFAMGDDADPKAKPGHRVNITKTYFVDKTEVTVGMYKECVAAGQCTATSIHGPNVKPGDEEVYASMCNESKADREDHPINCVDITQAKAYCDSVGKRLPSEAEWEFAARGSDGRIYPWGNEAPGCGKAVVSGCGRQSRDAAGTKAVGSYPDGASPSGALDMAGNVWEWVADGMRSYPSDEQTDPVVGPAGDEAILRGGSWDFGAPRLKSTYRQRFNGKDGHVSTGFRCAKSE